MTIDELNNILQACMNIRNRINSSVIHIGINESDLLHIERTVRRELKRIQKDGSNMETTTK